MKEHHPAPVGCLVLDPLLSMSECYFLSVHREVQYIVLQNIATMSIQRKVSLHSCEEQ